MDEILRKRCKGMLSFTHFAAAVRTAQIHAPRKKGRERSHEPVMGVRIASTFTWVGVVECRLFRCKEADNFIVARLPKNVWSRRRALNVLPAYLENEWADRRAG